MSTTAKKIESVMETMFQTVLGLDVFNNPAAMVVARGQPYVTSSVQISGDWNGVVSMSVPLDLALHFAALMFDVEDGETNDEDLDDAMGELANIASGSFKSMLDGHCQLGLPVVTNGIDYVVRFPGSTVECEIGFECEEECFHVTVMVGAD